MYEEKENYERAVATDRPTVTTKTTTLQKECSVQEELISALNQKLTLVLRQYEEEPEDGHVPGLAEVSRQSPLMDELDMIGSRIRRHNAALKDLLHRLEL